MTTQTHDDMELLHLLPQPTLSVRDTVRVAALGEAQDGMLRALAEVLTLRGARPAGPPFVRYHTFDGVEADLELGVPVAEPAQGEGRVASGELPGGSAVATWHLGAHDKLGDAYARLKAWGEAQGREPKGAAWEVYTWIAPLTYSGPAAWPDPSTWRTRLVQPLAGG